MPRKCTPEELLVVTAENVSVPVGHRAKCRTCGAVDNIKLVGIRRLKKCGACGSTLALRRSPRQPKIISYIVFFQLNGEDYGRQECVDSSLAENVALTFCERGPVARSRVAHIAELLDNEKTGSYRTLTYSNYRQRRQHLTWSSGCVGCKGKGLVAVTVRPAFGIEKAVIKFFPCSLCKALGGELTRKVMFGRRWR